MLETLFGSVLTAGITAASFTVCLIAALALGALVAAVYMYKNTGTQSMAVTLALLPAMVQIIILLVNGNLGAGVAVSGAFGLVRFRSAPGSARDITCIFLAMTLGLATGMGYIGIAVMTGVVMCLLLLVYAAMSFGRRPEEEKELKITIPENLDYTGLFDDLFAQYTRASELVSVRTTGMGSLYNLHYHVRLVSPEIEKQFLDAIRCRNGNLDIVCGKDLAELLGIIDGVELRAADERNAALHEIGVEAAAGIGAAIGGDEQIRAVKIRGLDRRETDLHGPVAKLRRISGLNAVRRRAGAAGSSLLFRALRGFDRRLVICRGLALDEAYRACRAVGQAVAQTVAVIVAHEPGLAVNKPYRALVACVDALSAAVALFLVYLNNSSYHLHCLQLIFTLQHYDIPGVKLAV